MVEALVCGLLVAVVIEDLARFRIRNGFVLLLCLGFVAHCIERDAVRLLLPHALLAGAALAALFVAFQRGLLGGGDAKLICAALLWVGPEGALVYAVLLFVLTLLTVLAARLGLVPSRGSGRGTRIPFAPAIAGAWLGLIGLTRLL